MGFRWLSNVRCMQPDQVVIVFLRLVAFYRSHSKHCMYIISDFFCHHSNEYFFKQILYALFYFYL